MRDYTKETSRIWHLVCYDEKVVHAICEKSTRWAYILHDKDILDDGSPKPPHYHVYSYRRNDTLGNFYVKLGRSISPDNGTVRVAMQTNAHDAVEYFQHADERSKEAKKTPYPLEAVVFDVKGNDNHFKSQEEREAELEKNRASQEADNLAFLNDIIVHRHNPITLTIRYGRSYIANKEKYDKFVGQLMHDSELPDVELLSDEARDAILAERERTELLAPDPDFGLVLLGLQSAEEAHKHAVINNLPPDVRVRAYNEVLALRKQILAFEMECLGRPHYGHSDVIMYRKQCIDAYLQQATPLNPDDFQ